jgi:hypothetical protein
MVIMNVLEKRDFIHSHLDNADEKVINELYERLWEEEILKAKLTSRAEKSENDIHSGKVFSQEEAEQRTRSVGR